MNDAMRERSTTESEAVTRGRFAWAPAGLFPGVGNKGVLTDGSPPAAGPGAHSPVGVWGRIAQRSLVVKFACRQPGTCV